MEMQEQPNVNLTFSKMHKTLLCERLGCLGLDWVVSGLFWEVGFFIGLGWLRVV